PANPFGDTTRPFKTAEESSLRLNNPRRRDAAMLPSSGWLALAFRTDNPGAWVFHCHIFWHVSTGLSIQYLERVS
ncbi:multicopper oxidase, partial [Calycina marina]